MKNDRKTSCSAGALRNSTGRKCGYGTFFSMDNGRTWSRELPVLKGENRKLLVKAKGSVTEEKPFLSGDYSFTSVLPPGFCQCERRRPGKGVCAETEGLLCLAETSVRILLSAGSWRREKGVIGVENKRNSSRKQWIDAPMPEVRCYCPGSISLYTPYLLADEKRRNGGNGPG